MLPPLVLSMMIAGFATFIAFEEWRYDRFRTFKRKGS